MSYFNFINLFITKPLSYLASANVIFADSLGSTSSLTSFNVLLNLKPNFSMTYYQVFFEALIERKREIFQYVQQYYRAFMGRKTAAQFPTFQFSWYWLVTTLPMTKFERVFSVWSQSTARFDCNTPSMKWETPTVWWTTWKRLLNISQKISLLQTVSSFFQ